jgi:hypothetical protein
MTRAGLKSKSRMRLTNMTIQHDSAAISAFAAGLNDASVATAAGISVPGGDQTGAISASATDANASGNLVDDGLGD